MKKLLTIGLLVCLMSVLMLGCEKTQEVSNTENEVDTEEIVAEESTEDLLSYYLVFASWENLDESSQGFFKSVYNDDLESAKEMYSDYFLKFNLIHEMSHTIQGQHGYEGTRFEKEQSANDIAIAYWRLVDEPFVETVQKHVAHMLSVLPSPVPEGEDEATYFDENYRELSADPTKYGYYQFKFVQNALDSDATIHDLLKETITDNAVKPEDFTLETVPQPGEVIEVLSSFVSYLQASQVTVPYISPVDQGTPNIQFVMLKEDEK